MTLNELCGMDTRLMTVSLSLSLFLLEGRENISSILSTISSPTEFALPSSQILPHFILRNSAFPFCFLVSLTLDWPFVWEKEWKKKRFHSSVFCHPFFHCSDFSLLFLRRQRIEEGWEIISLVPASHLLMIPSSSSFFFLLLYPFPFILPSFLRKRKE